MTMAESSSESAGVAGKSTAAEDIRAIVSRVLSLSIFFVGVGIFAAIGLALHQTAMLAEYQLTYFSVGVAVGVVGVLLWLVAR